MTPLLIACPHCQRDVYVPANVETTCPKCRKPVIAEDAPQAQAVTQPVVQGLPNSQIALVVVLLLILGWITWNEWTRPDTTPRPPSDYVPAARVASNISNEELQKDIADVYKVQTSRFINSDLLWITLPPGTNVQKTCQAIANLWAHRSGKDFVRVESWSGNTRLGQGTVQFGQIRTP